MFNRLFFSSLLVLLLQLSALSVNHAAEKIETAVLAGGCFWCIESDYEKLDGIVDVVSGYTGGHVKNPSYREVSSGRSGHIEAVKISYDASKISYTKILDYFWRHIDPTRDDGQFCDGGPQYRPAIFYQDKQQHELALASVKQIEKIKPFKAALKVELIKGSIFYPAEDYHQDYYKKSPIRYKIYRLSCGRDARVEDLWGESD